MDSTLTPKANDDPHDVVVVAPDAVRVAPSHDEISELLRGAARHRADAQVRAAPDSIAGPTIPPVDTTFRPAALDVDGPSMARRLARGFVALLLAACIGGGALVWKAYGDTAAKQIAKLATQVVMIVSEKPAVAAQPTGLAVQADATNTAACGSVRQRKPAPGRRRAIRRSGAVAAIDRARSRKPGATGRATQGQHRAAQGQPATDVARPCQSVRGEGFRGQGVRAEPAAEDSSASAAPGRRADAEAVTAICAAAANAGGSPAAAGRRTLRAASHLRPSSRSTLRAATTRLRGAIARTAATNHG